MSDSKPDDQRLVAARVKADKDRREKRFQRLLTAVSSNDILKNEVINTLNMKEEQETALKDELYRQWQQNVFERIQDQISEKLNPLDRRTVGSVVGKKSVGFSIPAEKPKAYLPSSSDPLKTQLRETADQDAFYRSSKAFLRAASTQIPLKRGSSKKGRDTWPDKPGGFGRGGGRDGGNSSIHRGSMSVGHETLRWSPDNLSLDDGRQAHLLLHRSRPILEPELWNQVKLQGTPYGHFAQVCEAGPGGPLKTMFRTSISAPNEADGVPSAGKKKSRRKGNNDLGILEPGVVQLGETGLYKSVFGGSSGAPNQDHFRFPQGDDVVDMEFPLGKKMWKVPPGHVPRHVMTALMEHK